MELPDLAAIEARANGASDEPWIVVHEPAWEADNVQHPDVIRVGAPLYVGDDEPVTICLVSTDYEDDPVDVLGDAEFIAHARTDVPALVAALREARAERDAYKRAKQENDERFMLERDDWRRRYEALRDGVTGLCYDPDPDTDDGMTLISVDAIRAVVARVEGDES